jgi:dephospho-CoA kinase
MDQKIIFLIGMPASGKGTVAKLFHGYKKFAFGDIIREECLRKFGDTSPSHIEATVSWFHTDREHLLSVRMWKRVKKNKNIVIDGCRNRRQFEHFCKLAKLRPTVVYVYSPRTYRWKLLKARGRKDSGSYAYLIRRDNRELKQGLDYMITQTDFRISNRGTKNQLKKKTFELLKKLK